MACVYTPRGLKVRLKVEDVFVYIARVGGKFTPFSALQLVESFENLPLFIGLVGAILGAVHASSAIGFVVWIALSRILGIVIARIPSIAIALMFPLSWVMRCYDILAGYGLLFGVVLAVAWLYGGWIWALCYLGLSPLLSLGGVLVSSSEQSFWNACRYMAIWCGVRMDRQIADRERSSVSWALMYSDLCASWPKIVHRFEYEDEFFGRFDEVANTHD